MLKGDKMHKDISKRCREKENILLILQQEERLSEKVCLSNTKMNI